ncbi:MAG: hypothetical protein K8T20_16095 [Planctomycetes bacterium]|nr:hypothetical protein [Planctomycetota bacterium]
MRSALLVGLAMIPGLCEEKQDPAKGVPADVWALRQVMEKETTKDQRGEYVTPEQAERFRDAAESVATFKNVQNPDEMAEVMYLLPRTWQWPQRQALRDLLVVLAASKAGPVLEAEALQGQETGFRKQAMLAILRLHREIKEMTPADRVARVLKDASEGAWNDGKFGWRSDLLFEYGAMALANDPGESIPKLAELSARAGPLCAWALTTLARIDDPRAAEALKPFYGTGDALQSADDRARAAAFRFWSAFRNWPDALELPVLVPGETFTLHPFAGRAATLDRAAYDTRIAEPPALSVKLGVPDEALGRAAFVADGDRASVILVEQQAGKVPRVLHFRMRRRGEEWYVGRWEELRP